jgi:hypothetical protein
MTREIYAPVSVIEPVGKAIEEVKRILFSPFNLEKWFTIGFCAWLAFLGTSGGGGPGGGGGNSNQSSGQSPQAVFEQGKEWVVANLSWLIPLVCVVVTVIILISLVLCWLRSRGQFMFLHCVAKNKAEVSIPWTKYGPQGNSLFLFQIVFGLISFVLVALYLAAVGLCIFFLWKANQGSGQVSVPMVLGIIAGSLGFIMLCIVLAVVMKFTLDFVVPIMYLRTTTCMDAWSEFMEIWSARKGALFVYILFQFVIFIAIGALIGAAYLITCCCACCITMIPYIGTVFLLPILVFKRSYSLHYLRQFGSDFDVFLPEPEVEPMPVIVI